MGAVSAFASDAISGTGRRTGAKTTQKKRETTMTVPCRFRSKRQTHSRCFLLYCCWSFLVHRRPSSAAPAAERCCVQAERKRCASPEELQVRAEA
jgi:hypothetical protein